MPDEPAKQKSDAALREEAILEFWQKEGIFEKSLTKDSPKGEFVFYEGPPTANAKPALHHLEARAFKDAIPRYKTMAGYHVRRRAGWDTHGLPVELQIEKALGFTGKPDIEKYGIEAFNQKCRESVLEYIGIWEQFTDRIGYWVDKKSAYYTFDADYMESLWWILGQANERELLYKDYKVVPWCSRCGTALSSHELAQGYKDVKDLSVTAKFELVDEPGTYVLAWTTTPWTLPGNVGLTVGEKIKYGEYKKDNEVVIIADELATKLGEGWERIKDRPVTSLIEKKYKPLYPYLADIIDGEEKDKLVAAYKIYPADFVTTTDGTGIVHTAVMYGQDDFELGTKVGLPKIHLVKPDGKFIDDTDFLAGRFVRDEDVAVDIIKDLAGRGLLFSKEKYEHTYPFCWRCSTPLIYYARDSWYIEMSALKDQLLDENAKINWEPGHIKEGRFGEWLSGVKDWAISRERYWGTPLPVWLSADGKERLVISSVEQLKARTKKSGNKYFVMRHGEADNNVQKINSAQRTQQNHHLTQKGKDVAHAKAKELGSVDLIFSSPFVRTTETAQAAAEALGIPKDQIIFDERLREVDTGEHDGKSGVAYNSVPPAERFDHPLPTVEPLAVVRTRMMEFLYEVEQKYSGKKILIVSHGDPLWVVQLSAQGLQKEKLETLPYPELATPTPLPFIPLPHNKDYELDLHRPYIDQVVLIGDSGAELKRTPEVMDVWFDSGAMPLAQDHYPFENKEFVDGGGYPADYISEAIDQTRGWFYTLLAIGTFLGRGTPYKNVICLGHLLDDKGAKMSKSKGNIVEPFAAMDEHGVDLLRYWMYSVNSSGEGKNYDQKVLNEIKNKVFNPLLNALQFYSLYSSELVLRKEESGHVLDQWILTRMNQLIVDMTNAFDAYDMLGASRPVKDFLEDFSTWYIRRSRDRMKGDDESDKQAVLNTMRMVFMHVAQLMSPLTPFIAEEVYQKIRIASDPESVHLCEWPMPWPIDEDLLKDMAEVRRVVSIGLEKRQKENIKVRQPLQTISTTVQFEPQFVALIADELNVKEVVFDKDLSEEVVLDTTITEELREEGELRDLIREVQDLRKTAGLNAKDSAILSVPAERVAFIEKHWSALAKATGLKIHETGAILGVKIST